MATAATPVEGTPAVPVTVSSRGVFGASAVPPRVSRMRAASATKFPALVAAAAVEPLKPMVVNPATTSATVTPTPTHRDSAVSAGLVRFSPARVIRSRARPRREYSEPDNERLLFTTQSKAHPRPEHRSTRGRVAVRHAEHLAVSSNTRTELTPPTRLVAGVHSPGRPLPELAGTERSTTGALLIRRYDIAHHGRQGGAGGIGVDGRGLWITEAERDEEDQRADGRRD